MLETGAISCLLWVDPGLVLISKLPLCGLNFLGRFLPQAWMTFFTQAFPIIWVPIAIWSLMMQLHTLQFSSLEHGNLGIRSGRRKGTAHCCFSSAAALVAVVVMPGLSCVFFTEPRRDCSAGGSQQCSWCSPQLSLGTQFLSNGHKVFALKLLVPGQTNVSAAGWPKEWRSSASGHQRETVPGVKIYIIVVCL